MGQTISNLTTIYHLSSVAVSSIAFPKYVYMHDVSRDHFVAFSNV